MKKMAIISLVMIVTSSTAMAHGYGYRPYYGPDPVDFMAAEEIADISAQERADVMHELREGDFREAQEIMQYDEGLKNEIRREEAMYDAARDMNRFNYDYGYYGW